MLYFIHKCPKLSLKSICRESSSSAFDFAWFLLIQRYTARASSDLSSEWYKVFRSPECLQFTLLGCLLLPSSSLLVLLIGNMQLMTYACLHSSNSHPSSTRCKPPLLLQVAGCGLEVTEGRLRRRRTRWSARPRWRRSAKETPILTIELSAGKVDTPH